MVRRNSKVWPFFCFDQPCPMHQVVGTLRTDAGVFAWQLGNEAFLSGFAEKSELDEWTMLLREAIRELDPKRPIGLGLDAETFFRETGVDARDAVATCEFAVSHVTADHTNRLPITVQRRLNLSAMNPPTGLKNA